MYDTPDKIDMKGIINSLTNLHLLNDDVYLVSQATNLGIVDNFITDIEYQVLKELNEIERTPELTFFLGAQSQMWVFAAYELLRTWKQRSEDMIVTANNGGLTLKLKELKRRNKDFMHFGRELRIMQIENIINNPSVITEIKNQLSHLHIPYVRLEYIRVCIAKHEVRGRDKSIAMTPGYGRINSWCGSLDYDFTNGQDSMGYISRRDIADSIRALDFSQAPPSNEELKEFDQLMKEFQKGFQIP
jgi:hypothetical protein